MENFRKPQTLVSILLISVFFLWGNVLAADIYPLRSEEKRLFNQWKRPPVLGKDPFQDPQYQKRIFRDIKWMGKFKEKEKQEVFSYIESGESGFMLQQFSKVLKTDLENDGNPDYVIQELFIKNSQPHHYGTAFGIVSKVKGNFRILILSISRERRNNIGEIIAVDLNGNGFKEIIFGWQDDRDESDDDSRGDIFRNVIYKNGGGFFWPVYERKTFSNLKIEDLDGNGIPEVLETVNESEKEPITLDNREWWINVFNLSGLGVEKTNHKYLNFYKEKKKEYEALKKEAREKEIEAQKRGELCPGCEHSAYFYIEQVMDEYIGRINKMINDDLTRK